MPENEAEPLPIGEWFYQLIWCPSQCYCRLRHNEIDYILYLRWRWANPWHGHVIKNADSLAATTEEEAVWSEGVFALNHVQYGDDEIEMAKEELFRLFHEFNGEYPARSRPKLR